jgi:hypothetical protein
MCSLGGKVEEGETPLQAANRELKVSLGKLFLGFIDIEM